MRLIDADLVYQETIRYSERIRNLILKIINALPSINIIRCRECKYLEQRFAFGNYPSGNKENFCTYHWKFGFKDDDFCSYAESK